MSVEEAVHRDLAGMGSLSESALAASALALARALDDPETYATAKSNCAKELRETLDRLRQLALTVREDSPLDEIRARRDARLDRQSAASG